MYSYTIKDLFFEVKNRFFYNIENNWKNVSDNIIPFPLLLSSPGFIIKIFFFD